MLFSIDRWSVLYVFIARLTKIQETSLCVRAVLKAAEGDSIQTDGTIKIIWPISLLLESHIITNNLSLDNSVNATSQQHVHHQSRRNKPTYSYPPRCLAGNSKPEAVEVVSNVVHLDLQLHEYNSSKRTHANEKRWSDPFDTRGLVHGASRDGIQASIVSIPVSVSFC